MSSRWLLVVGVVSALVAGCSAEWYRGSADRQVYQVIAQTQERELHRSQPFSIEPPAEATAELEALRPLATGKEVEEAVGGAPAEPGTAPAPPQGSEAEPASPAPRAGPAGEPAGLRGPLGGAAAGGPSAERGSAEVVPGGPAAAQGSGPGSGAAEGRPLDKFALLERSGQPVPVPEAARVLGLADVLLLAYRHNRDFLTREEKLYLTALALTLEQYRWSPQFRAVLSGEVARSGLSPRLSTWESGAELGMSLALPQGGDLEASVGTDFSGDFGNRTAETALTTWALSFTQPLLRGFGRTIAQEPLVQAERDVIYEVRLFERFRRTFAVDVAEQFYRVLQRVDTVRNEWTNYRRFIEVHQMTKALAEAGRVRAFEVDQAEQDRLQARNSWVSAVEDYELELDRFKIQLGLPTEVPVVLDARELDRLRREERGQPPAVSLEEASRIALASRLDLLVEQDRVADTQRRVRVQSDQLRGDLTLSASASVPSPANDKPLSAQFHGGSYQLGLDYDLPVDRFTERNRYREALIALARQRRSLSLAEDNVKLDVRRAYRRVQQALESYRIQQYSVELARGRVENVTLLLRLGRAITRDLLEPTRAYVQVQNRLTQALVDLRIARLELRRDMGLLEIDQRGMWSTWGVSEERSVESANE